MIGLGLTELIIIGAIGAALLTAVVVVVMALTGRRTWSIRVREDNRVGMSMILVGVALAVLLIAGGVALVLILTMRNRDDQRR